MIQPMYVRSLEIDVYDLPHMCLYSLEKKKATFGDAMQRM
jgi:hypothetical protein